MTDHDPRFEPRTGDESVAYEAGRREERASAVAYLRAHNDNEVWPEQHDKHPRDYADELERGDHDH